jgi:hypothetical protein
MFGIPEDVISQLIHELSHRLGLVKDRDEMVIRIPPLIDRRGILTSVFKIYVTSEEG